MTLPVALAKGENFTVEIQLDVSGIPEDTTDFTATFYIAVTPAIAASEDFLDSLFPDMERVRPFFATPSRSLFFGSTGVTRWTQGEIEEYMQDGAERMVSELEKLETGAFFQDPDI